MITLVTTRVVELRLGAWDRGQADQEELAREEGPAIDPADEARGLRWALWAVLGVLVVVLALTCRRARRCATRRPATSSATRR